MDKETRTDIAERGGENYRVSAVRVLAQPIVKIKMHRAKWSDVRYSGTVVKQGKKREKERGFDCYLEATF